MYMRLGFSVAVHVDPEILLIDEVLAVGDAKFMGKCMDRMNYFKKMGKIIILVTHDIGMVRSWCDQAVWLHEGMTKMSGKPMDVVEAYTKYMLQ
jgi:ABC-type polysaccharide/polyol phosphate transport system ATPase subunit